MKIKKQPTCNYLIEITVVFEPDFSNIAAARVQHPAGIAKEYKYSEQQLADFNDLVESVISVILHYSFEIVKETQSHKSYAYYIEFFPTDDDGNKWNESIGIKFRLANHANAGAESESARNVVERMVDKPRGEKIIFIKSFHIGSNEYPGPMSVIRAVDTICKGLKKGNYDILDKYR